MVRVMVSQRGVTRATRSTIDAAADCEYSPRTDAGRRRVDTRTDHAPVYGHNRCSDAMPIRTSGLKHCDGCGDAISAGVEIDIPNTLFKFRADTGQPVMSAVCRVPRASR